MILTGLKSSLRNSLRERRGTSPRPTLVPSRSWLVPALLLLLIAAYYLPEAYRLWGTLMDGESELYLATKLQLNPGILPPGGMARDYQCCEPTLAPLINAAIYRLTHANLLVLEYLWLLAQALAGGVGMYLVGKELSRSRWGALLCAALTLGFARLHLGGLTFSLNFGPYVLNQTLGVACLPWIVWAYLAGRLALAYVFAAVCLALHPIFGALAALVMGPEALRRLAVERDWRGALAGPLAFLGLALACAAVLSSSGRLGLAAHSFSGGASGDDFWNLMWLRKPEHFFAFSLGVWKELWVGVAATTLWILAVSWRLWRGCSLPPASGGMLWRLWALMLGADVVSLAGGVASDLLRNVSVGVLILPRIYVVVLILEHGLLAALIVRAVARGRPGEALVGLLALWLAQRGASLPLSFSLALALWCLIDRDNGRRISWKLGAGAYAALLALFAGIYAVGWGAGQGAAGADPSLALSWSSASWLEAMGARGGLVWVPLLTLATWLDGPPQAGWRERIPLLSERWVRRGAWVLLCALLLPTGLRWAGDALVWPCLRDPTTGRCSPGRYGSDEAWYQVQRAAHQLTPRGSRFITPFERHGFEFFSERESVLQWEYVGWSAYDRSRLGLELERLRSIGFDLSPGPPMSGKAQIRRLSDELRNSTAQQWRDLSARTGARYLVTWQSVYGGGKPESLPFKVLYADEVFVLVDLGQ